MKLKRARSHLQGAKEQLDSIQKKHPELTDEVLWDQWKEQQKAQGTISKADAEKSRIQRKIKLLQYFRQKKEVDAIVYVDLDLSILAQRALADLNRTG